jgi:SNF2 family DNA or RNA helicase
MSKFFKISSTALPHQERVLQKLREHPALLLYHGTGSGKTLTSLLAAEDQGLEAAIIGPASLRHNYPKEQAKHKTKAKFKYYTYHKPPDPDYTKDKLLIFDEAHNMGRVESMRSHYPDIYEGAKELYMTATPIRNSPDELIPLIRGLGVNLPRDRVAFNQAFIEEVEKKPGIMARIFKGVKSGVEKQPKNISVLSKALKGRIDYYKPENLDTPTSSTETLKVEMSKDQYKTYKEFLKGNPSLLYKIRRGLPPSKTESKQLNAFLSASRQISNTPRGFDLHTKSTDEPKIERMANEIEKHVKSDANYKGVSYSNYLDSGVNPLAERLEARKIPYAKFTGKLTNKQKASIIKDYNEGKIKHLLISGAGAEGLDLKGTKLLQVMEPHWNEPRIEQVMGRAIRIGSHSHLPKEERHVKIQRFLSTPREEGILFKNRPMGADEYLTMLSNKKEKLNEAFLKALRS